MRLLLLALFVPTFAAAQVPGTREYDAWKTSRIRSTISTPSILAPQLASETVPPSAARFDAALIPFSATDGTWTPLPANDDQSTGLIPLGFSFDFYGESFIEGCVNNNGNISFEGCFSTYSPVGFPSTSFQMVAGFWSDIDTRGPGSGLAWYKQTTLNGTPVFAVTYDSTGYFNGRVEKRVTLQIVLADTPTLPGGNNVCFVYGNMDFTTGEASGGINGFGGSPATVGTNKGDGVTFFQYGRYDKPGTDYDGPDGDTDGVDGLDGQQICLNTGASATNIPPVVSSAPGNVLTTPVGTPLSFSVQFIAPESNQSTALSTSGLPAWLTCALSNGIPGGTATATCSGTPPSADISSVSITATDDGSPSLSTTYTIRIVVEGGTPPDSTPPVCGPLAFDMAGNGSVFSTIADPESGIASVRFTLLRNLTGSVSGAGPFAVGDTYAVPGAPPTIDLRGTRVDPAVRSAGLVAVITNGAGLASTCDPVVADLAVSSDVTALGLPSPNPLQGAARIPFALAEAATVRLTVYDALGREVVRLVDGETLAAGGYSATWDGRDGVGRSLAAGVYVVRLTAGTLVQTRTLTIVR